MNAHTAMISFHLVDAEYRRMAREFKGPMVDFIAAAERMVSAANWSFEEFSAVRLGDVIDVQYEVLTD